MATGTDHVLFTIMHSSNPLKVITGMYSKHIFGNTFLNNYFNSQPFT